MAKGDLNPTKEIKGIKVKVLSNLKYNDEVKKVGDKLIVSESDLEELVEKGLVRTFNS
jgi:hypothetical protein